MERTDVKDKYISLGIGTISLLCLGLIYAWSVFKVPMQELLPQVTDTELSMTFTISMVFFCLGGFFSGILAKKTRLKNRLLFSGLFVLAGMILMSRITSSTMSPVVKMYASYGVLCGFGVGIGYNSILSFVLGLFPGKAGVVSGILLMGFGFGGLVLGSLAIYLEGQIGIQSTYLILGLMLAAVMFIAALYFGRDRQNNRQNNRQTTSLEARKAGENTASTDGSSMSEKRLTPGSAPNEMVKSKYFYLFVFWLILVSASGLMIINNAAQIVSVFGATAVIGLLISVANGAGRVIFGRIFDTKGKNTALFASGILLAAAGGMMLVGDRTSFGIIGVIGLLLTGICYGSCPSLTSSIIKEVYGAENFPANFSIANFQLILSALIGPTLSSVLFSLSGGTYTTSFIVIIVFAAVAITLSLTMRSLEENSTRPIVALNTKMEQRSKN